MLLLYTKGWQKAVDKSDNLEAIDRLVTGFTIPLQSAGSQIEETHAQCIALLEYATQYVSLSTMDYRGVWWCCFHASSTSEWTNTLTLGELLFSLPVSNGTLERVFFHRLGLSTTREHYYEMKNFDDLLIVATDDLMLNESSPDAMVEGNNTQA